MKRLLKFLSDYKKECVLAPLFKMLEASFELFVPLVIASIIVLMRAQRLSTDALIILITLLF